jgi:hypothetical protein
MSPIVLSLPRGVEAPFLLGGRRLERSAKSNVVTMYGGGDIEKLDRGHKVDTFDCGRKTFNRFLSRYALPNQQAEASQTYVALRD